MQIFTELLKYGVIQAILPSLLAIGIVFVTKNRETKISKETYIFEKKREAFTNVLSLITKTIVSIKANFSWEEEKYFWIAEEECDNFQMAAQKEMLYLSDDDIVVIQLIIETLRNNSSWQSNIMNWEESIGFATKDISFIEYLHKTLIDSFRNKLFEKKDAGKNKSIVFLQICYLLHNHKNLINLIEKSRFLKFDYTENSILKIINNCFENANELRELVIEIINNFEKETDHTEYDRQKIDELSNLLIEMK